jgi:hypothetical protein
MMIIPSWRILIMVVEHFLDTDIDNNNDNADQGHGSGD